MPKKLLFNFNREVIQDYTYIKYSGTIIAATNTLEKPIKGAILKGSTKYRDIDTGEILESFEDGRNLELVSVKMPVLTTTGKNLWDDNWSKGLTQTNGSVITGGTYDGFRYNNNLICVDGIDVIYLKHFCPQEGVPQSFRIGQYGKDKEWLNKPLIMVPANGAIRIPSGCKYVRIHVDLRYNGTSNNTSDSIPTMMVVSTSKITDYEPHKSNILTVNEDVTLRSNGDICDELNLLTGQLTQRIGEDGVVLSQEVVKTVDLSILDQNENKVSSISSFNDTTHITASSETIPPIFEGYLATKEVE